MTSRDHVEDEKMAELFEGLEGLTERRRSARFPSGVTDVASPEVLQLAPKKVQNKTRLVQSAHAVACAPIQRAVIKLTHYAFGRDGIRALFNSMHSDECTVIYDHCGRPFYDVESTLFIADLWADKAPLRSLSQDVFRFRVWVVEKSASLEQAASAMHSALIGHSYAWISDRKKDLVFLDIVATAAAIGRAGEKGVRIRDRQRDIRLLHEKFDLALKAESKIEILGFDHGYAGVRRYLHLLTDNDRLPARSVCLNTTSQIASTQSFSDHASIYREARTWPLHSRAPRDVVQILFCAKAGTPATDFFLAVQDTLAHEFAGFDYVYCLQPAHHHIFVRAAIRMDPREGKRLDPGVGDLHRWRQTLSQMASARSIPMTANRAYGNSGSEA